LAAGLSGGLALGGAGFIALAVRLAFSRAGDAVDERADGLYDVKPAAKHARNLFAFSSST